MPVEVILSLSLAPKEKLLHFGWSCLLNVMSGVQQTALNFFLIQKLQSILKCQAHDIGQGLIYNTAQKIWSAKFEE